MNFFQSIPPPYPLSKLLIDTAHAIVIRREDRATIWTIVVYFFIFASVLFSLFFVIIYYYLNFTTFFNELKITVK